MINSYNLLSHISTEIHIDYRRLEVSWYNTKATEILLNLQICAVKYHHKRKKGKMKQLHFHFTKIENI
jgi:hypothetical protein